MNRKAWVRQRTRLVFVLFLLTACGTPQPKKIAPSPTTRPPTAAITATPTIKPSATFRPTSTTKPPQNTKPSSTPKVMPTSTSTAEPEETPQQTTTLPDGTLLLTFDKLDVIGTQEFIDQTSQALSLLKDKSPEAFHKIETYVSLIKLGEHSGMWAFENPPRYEVGERTANAGTAWYASTIAHDATHSELYHEYLAQKGAPVPDDAWASVAAEQFCIAFQLKVLKEVGGTASEIEYLESQTGTHCDVDNDGDCDWNDYENRDW